MELVLDKHTKRVTRRLRFSHFFKEHALNTEGKIVLLMMGVPGGQGSKCPVGAAGWWLQHSEHPAHENAAPKRHLDGSSLHSEYM